MTFTWEFIGEINGTRTDIVVPISKIAALVHADDGRCIVVLDLAGASPVIVCGYTFRECADALAANKRLPTSKQRANAKLEDERAMASAFGDEV